MNEGIKYILIIKVFGESKYTDIFYVYTYIQYTQFTIYSCSEFHLTLPKRKAASIFPQWVRFQDREAKQIYVQINNTKFSDF